MVLATAGFFAENHRKEDTFVKSVYRKHRQIKNFCAVVTLIFAGCLSLSGQEISEKDNKIVEKIKQANTKYSAITSDFKQIRRLAIVEGETVSTGKFFYLKPESLAMYYSQPANDVMMIGGDRFYMLAAGKITKASAKINAKVRRMKTILSACLQGDVKQIEFRKITCSETDKNYTVTVEIGGKTRNGVINKVSVSYDKDDFSPSILKTEEPDGSYTEYELMSKTFNQPPDAKIFANPKASR